MDIARKLAEELGVREAQTAATIRLLDEGATVPFIARYRKEVTGGLDDTQLRQLEERLRYRRELEERRRSILASIREQGKLDEALAAAIQSADTKTVLEDLYLPYRPKRRNKAQQAREAGLEPLAEAILGGAGPDAVAGDYLNPEHGIGDAQAALEGARQILMERFAEDPAITGRIRERLREAAWVTSQVVAEKAESGAKFADYFDYRETLSKIPSHRALALLRGRQEGVLTVRMSPNGDDDTAPLEAMLAHRFEVGDGVWLRDTVRRSLRIKLYPRLETELLGELRERAELEAIQVFAHNLRDLLLAAPAGPHAIMGLDPGLRTGVKVAVIDPTGKLVATDTIYPHAPQRRWDEAIQRLARLAAEHKVSLVSIGNGTASRETDKLAAELIQRHPELKLQKLMVSEAGASVYSASELAAREFPALDVSLRGAVSIARRLQDPLAELVKIEPRAIGVGQYQHDLNQTRLAQSLDAVVEDCVNAVGVDLNTASAALLARVAGLTASLAENIVRHRDQHGAFRSRRELIKVSRLGERTFEQAAGFLRIMDGANPLDRSAVHPEAYPVAERIIRHCGKPLPDLIGNGGLLGKLDPKLFVDERFGLPTVRDILAELEKPGRDPRPAFRTASFREGVETLQDLKPGMRLEGVISNVTNFGAFVDIGVHQDGLVHISQLADRFVRDPREVVKAGDVVQVKVLEVDLPRKRIALSMRSDAEPSAAQPQDKARPDRVRNKNRQRPESGPAGTTAMADALARAKNR